MTQHLIKILGRGLVAALLVCGGPVLASTTILPSDTDQINLETDKGVLIRLDRPASTVFVANPEIADIQVKSPRLIYLFAKKPGETTLYAVDQAERVLAIKERGLLACYELAEMGRKIVKKHLAKVAKLRARQGGF